MHESYTTKSESQEDKTEADFMRFIKEGDFSASDIRSAYYKLCGGSESEDITDEQMQIVTKMEEMVGGKFLMNRFVKLIEQLDEIERTVEAYKTFIDSLPVSEREKEVLISIVRSSRAGELEFYIDDELYTKVEIPRDSSSESTALQILQGLSESLKNVSDRGKLSIQFTEE